MNSFHLWLIFGLTAVPFNKLMVERGLLKLKINFIPLTEVLLQYNTPFPLD